MTGPTPAGQPSVSVIVPVYNDPEGLRACLDGLAGQTYRADRMEVIVVDNGSGSSPEGIVGPDSRIILAFESRPGSYAARNRGLTLAEGNVIAFTDADCIPEPDWIERGVEALATAGPAIVAGRVDAFPGTPNRPNPVELYEIVYGYRQRWAVEQFHSCFTANAFTTRALLEDAGVFNETLLSGGDFAWSRRAHGRGYPVLYEDRAIVRTPARRSLAALARRTARLAGGGRQLVSLREGGASWLVVSPRPRRSRLEDLRLLLAYNDAPNSAKLLACAVALYVRAVSRLESVRLALGGSAIR